jgi:hypothetical protein
MLALPAIAGSTRPNLAEIRPELTAKTTRAPPIGLRMTQRHGPFLRRILVRSLN